MGVRQESGIRPGNYRISFYPAPTKSANELPTDVVSSGSAGIPQIFTNPNSSPLETTVGPTGAAIDVKLTKDPREATVVANPPPVAA